MVGSALVEHHVEQNVAQIGGERRGRERERDRVPPEREGGAANVERLGLSLLAETKSTKVCVLALAGSLPMARRGNNDGRHMGDSPGAQREESLLAHLPPLRRSVPFALRSRGPLCGPDFTD